MPSTRVPHKNYGIESQPATLGCQKALSLSVYLSLYFTAPKRDAGCGKLWAKKIVTSLLRTDSARHKKALFVTRLGPTRCLQKIDD
jgi:hypothetical protein